MKRSLYILPANKSFMIDESAWQKLACYKMFRAPTYSVKLGKRVVPMSQIFPWPPGEPSNLFDIPDRVVRRLVDRPMVVGKKVVANLCQLC